MVQSSEYQTSALIHIIVEPEHVRNVASDLFDGAPSNRAG